MSLIINESFSTNAGVLTLVNGSGLQYSGGNVYFYNATSPSDHVLLYSTNGVDGTVELQFYSPIDNTIDSEMHLIYRLDDSTHYYYLKIINNTSGNTLDFSHWIRSSGSHNNLSGLTNASITNSPGNLFKVKLIYVTNKLTQIVIENLTQSISQKLSNLTLVPYTYTTANKVGFAFVPSVDTQNSGNSDGSMSFKVDSLKTYDNAIYYPYIASGSLSVGSSFQVTHVSFGMNGGFVLGSNSLCKYRQNANLYLDKNFLFYYESFDNRIGPFLESNPSNSGYSYTGGKLIRSIVSNQDDILYVPCDRNSKIYINFVCPNTGYLSTGSTTTLTLVYRYKNSSEYKRIYISFNNTAGGSNIHGFHSTQNGPDSIGYGEGEFTLPANPSDNFEAFINVSKNNLYFYIKNITQNQYKSSKIDFGVSGIIDNYFSDQRNVGFTFASNQTFATNNGTPGAESFKINAFSAEPVSYELVNVKYVSVGGLSLGSTPIVKARYKNYIASGSLLLKGDQLLKSSNFHYRFNGGVVLGGTLGTIKVPNRKYFPLSGILINGLAGSSTTLNTPDYDLKFYTAPLLVFGITLPTQAFNYIADGSLLLGGSSLLRPKYYFKNNLFNGGVALGGLSNYRVGKKYIPNSGLVLGGTSLTVIKDYKYVAFGTLIIGSSILLKRLTVRYISSGSLLLGGQSRITSSYKYTCVGGLTLGGTSTYKTYLKYKYTPNSGLVLGGTPLNKNYYKYKYTPNSGLILSGTALNKYSIRLKYTATGGLILGGVALNKYSIRLKYTATGGLDILGKSKNNNKKDIRNFNLDPNNINNNELTLVRIKKEDNYLKWKYKKDVILPKFVDNSK